MKKSIYKNIILYVIVIMLLICNFTYAGDVSFRLKGAYGSFKMTDLKHFQEEIKQEFINEGFPVRITEEFPSYLIIQLQVYFLTYKDFHFGLVYDYASTGGRIHLKDYSGEIGTNQIISRDSYGLIIEKSVYQNNYFEMFVFSQLTIILSKLEIIYLLELDNKSYESEDWFEGNSFGLEPGIALNIPYNNYFARINLSYQLDSQCEFNLENNNLLNFINIKNNYNCSWSGLRFGISLGYNL